MPLPIRPTDKILRENLICALFLAIRNLELNGRGQSAQAQGWRDNLEALQAGRALVIQY